jgi:hypothetical protein
MFGYIRPDAPELKIKDFERFRACYCGICHELGDRYGLTSRFILNYDFVFLTMLLWHEDEPSDYCFRRCLPSFCRKRCVCASSRALSISAGYSVILFYWKLCDSVKDSGWLKSLAYRFIRLWLKPAYKKASQEYSEFAESVLKYLTELSELESNNESSMDRAADKFALILASGCECESDESFKRILRQLLYHIGRIIYIADAYDDLKDDLKHSQYNPIATRYSLTSANIGDDIKSAVLQTLSDSCGCVIDAYDLLPRNYWSDILDNIIYFGVPKMCRQVIDGTYNKKVKLSKQRTDNRKDWSSK